jgi:two-component sensor histidine kinase
MALLSIMVKRLTYLFCLLAMLFTAQGQSLTGKSLAELRALLQQSKPDSNRVLLINQLSRTYFRQVYNDERDRVMDTVIEYLDEAIELSNQLRLNHLGCESMMLKGEAMFGKNNVEGGKEMFFKVAGIHRQRGDVKSEAAVWQRLAIKIKIEPGNDDEVQGYFKRSIDLSTSMHYLEEEAYTRKYYGQYLSNIDRLPEAEQQLLLSLDAYKRSGVKKYASVYWLLSAVSRYAGAFDKSLLYATKCVETSIAASDTSSIDFYYGELAQVYDELDRVPESIEWYRKALQKRIERRADEVYILRTACFIVRQFIKQGKASDGLALSDSLAKAYPLSSSLSKATSAQNMALCYEAMNKYEKAEGHFLEMIRNYRAATLKDEFTIIANLDIAKFYLQRHQFKQAHIYLDTAVLYESFNPLTDRRKMFQMLFVADSALGNYKAAISNLRTYQLLNDSILNERKSRQIEALTVQFETDKKEQSIRLLEKEGKLQQNKLSQERNTRTWILGAVGLMAIIIFLLVNYLRLKQRTNKKLQIQQTEIEKKNTTLQHMVEEKEWLVREIHHRVKNNFQIVQGLLGTQSGYLKSDEAINALTDSRHRVQAMSMIHQKLYQSENMSSIDAHAYIHELVSHLQSSFNTRSSIQFNVNVDRVQLNLSHCIPVGLILNEAMTNAIKYAFPDGRQGVITISLRRNSPSHFVLCIGDNGVGLPATFNISNPGTMGLRLMRGLSEDIEGIFKIESNSGTLITVEFDYEPEQ